MNEAETRAELIDPALKLAGWGEVAESRVRRETIAPGRLQGSGKRAKPSIADYVLTYRNRKLAVIEAKKRDLSDTEGVGQAKRDATSLKTRFAFSTNGRRIYRIDMETGKEGYVDRYPTPEEMWDATFAEENAWRDRFAAVPYETRGGTFEPRYYQDNAIEAALDAIAKGDDRVLLTLATGTGKTAIAFQIAWKLFHSRWNLGDWKCEGEPTRRPRILFLADRNILANQAYNSFSAFPEDALSRVEPADIRKKGRVPKNASIFFTIFQTFMSGTDAAGQPDPYFGEYPPDFFDCIVVDECHRGGANDESTWRAILDHFSPAVQIGLTATPKRDNNVDTYAYFGEPVYSYSLKEGINDGYLTPFKVVQLATTIDEYLYTPDDDVLEGEVEEGKRYVESDFNRSIEIRQREEYRVRTFMSKTRPQDKTLVFCATQDHAALVRDIINQNKQSTDPNYCVRVTANDGALGEQHLRQFQDNEKTVPTILTTSQKLSTGVDARNVRNIVLMRPINSMIEFKQIIGRGTRLYDGKDYFTILDFVKAHHHFQDPDWDGDPIDPVTGAESGTETGEGSGETGTECGQGGQEGGGESNRPQKLKIKLADGKERTFQHIEATMFMGPDGTPLSVAQFIETLFGQLPDLFKDETELREIWSDPTTRRGLIEGLAERGFSGEQLDEIRKLTKGEDSDLFDVLAYIAYARPPTTRTERVKGRRGDILSQYDPKTQEFLDFVLSHYVAEGVEQLDTDNLKGLLTLKYGSTHDAAERLGSVKDIRTNFVGFQRGLYKGTQS
ncbi:DEAD/DEAH box helicase family protein [Pontixanthobacter aestiaquae]|uniref:DEAD/DEAH box helicase n=1 Tax=Pontixanthobacter aestiaquae TaxID=1509367 RepID=A0A844Z6V4_9SPHN|nr:type I restriction endonuclease subunit R [Pontixanthobacter aestiaquae]MDN3645771.1 DEAD/DEAH box helicase family protein [Pontixanthobacter aestiaquae]MXO83234.1 DEAD/DEAH box helicase [Pontixanthobacter aestiaquae]